MDLTSVVADWGGLIAVCVLAGIAVVVAVLQRRWHASDPDVPGIPFGAVAIGMTLVGIPVTLISFALTGLIDRPHTLAEDVAISVVPGLLVAIVMGAWTTIVAAPIIAIGERGRSVGVVALLLGGVLTAGFIAVALDISSSANATMHARSEATKEAALVERSSALHLDLSAEDVVYGARVDGERVVKRATIVLRLEADRPIEVAPEWSSMNVFSKKTFAGRSDRIALPAVLGPSDAVELRIPLAFDGEQHAGIAEPIVIDQPQDFHGQQWHAILFLQDSASQSYQVEADFTIPP